MYLSDMRSFLADYLEILDTNFSNVPKWQIILGTVSLTTGAILLQDLIRHRNEYTENFRSQAFESIKKIPAVRRKIEEEMRKTRNDMEVAIYETGESEMESFFELPSQGKNRDDILKLAEEILQLGKYSWTEGKVSGGVQVGVNQSYTLLMKEVYGLCSWTNPMHADLFPGIRKMEAEIIRMTINLFNGNGNAVGSMTSGGTESLVMMLKAYRNWGREDKGILHPEVVAADTIHAGVDKAAEILGVRLIKVGVDKDTGKIDLKQVRRAINGNTILVVGSAPEYAHGIIDDISGLSDITSNNGIGLHVDCCLGGFILPFMEEAGFPLDPFDFRVCGVTSISADTHKFGNCPKGSSVVMYREKKWIHYQYFSFPNWPGGIYATPTISGSRSGANIGMCWAALTYFGREGYVNITKSIISIAREIKKEFRKIPGLFVFGDPLGPVVSFGSDSLNVYKIADVMCEKGWHLQPLQHPQGIHIFLTSLHIKDNIVQELIQDLKRAVEIVEIDSSEAQSGIAKLYGIAHSLPDKTFVEDAAKIYLDVCYSSAKK